MPGFDAYEALEILKESGLDIPFIGVSGKRGNEIAAEMMKRGAADYLTKNSLERLVPAIKRELREAKSRRNQRTAESDLAAERKRLLVVLSSIVEGVITTDLQGNITLLNPAAEKLTSWTTTEANNLPLAEVFQLMYAQTRKSCPNPVTTLFESGNRQESVCPILLVDRHGSERKVVYSVMPIWDNCPNMVGAILVFRDVSEEEQAHEVLRNSIKLNSVGMLAGEIAHNFRNSLSGIFGNIELAQEYCRCDNQVKALERLNLTLNVFSKAQAQVHQMFSLTQNVKAVPLTMLVHPIISRSAKLVLHGSNIIYEEQIPQDLWPCKIDKDQMSLVFNNLFLSARQSMPDGGSIVVSAVNLAAESQALPLPISGDLVRISICDSGRGVDPRRLQSILNSCFDSKPCFEDNLVLASVCSIVKQYGGIVRGDSQVGKGTTMFLYIPRSDE